MFSDPQKVVHILGITPGMTIADVGAGSGEYTIALGKALGGSGKVYAVDIQKDLLGRIKQRANDEGITTVEVVWGDADEKGGIGLSDKSVDIVLATNILFQIEKRQQFAQELDRILKEKGRIVIVDWQDSFGGLGPRPDTVVGPDKAQEIFSFLGYKKVKEFNAGEHHYGLLLQKNV